MKSFGKRHPQLHTKSDTKALLFFLFNYEKNHEITKHEKVCLLKQLLLHYKTVNQLSDKQLYLKNPSLTVLLTALFPTLH